GPRDGDDRAVAGLPAVGVLREVLPQLGAQGLPGGPVLEVVRAERDVVVRPAVVARLVDEEEPVQPVDVTLVGREDAPALAAGERTARLAVRQPGTHALLDEAPLVGRPLRPGQRPGHGG